MDTSTSSRVPIMRSVSPPDAPEQTPAAAAPVAAGDRHVCPYCGLTGARPDGPCPRCTIEDTPQTRQATRARIGPWYVLQQRNPAAPGMKWSTLLALVKKGQVTPRSVVRGPTTHQLWRLASQVKGLSREFGLCYSCGVDIERTANQCPQCDRLQEPPPNPDVLLESREAARQVDVPEPASTEKAGPADAPVLAPRGEPRPDAGILTARELAAAFQLEFRPAGEEIEQAPAASKPASKIAPKPASKPASKPPSSRPGARWRIARVVLVLAALALVGGGAYVWMTPSHRATVIGYWEVASAKISERIEQWRSAPPAEPVAETGHASAATDESHPAPREQPATREPEVKPVPPAAVVPTDPELALQAARRLWSEAIDAEARGDWRAAVEAYEQIRRLPPDVRQTGLERRLADAKARLK